MPAASLVHDRLVGMVAHGWADLDRSALGLLAAVDAGLGEGSGTDPDLKKFAERTLPKIDDHLQRALKLAQREQIARAFSQ
jgi:hypothetical protein